jgi:hypothetical protein
MADSIPIEEGDSYEEMAATYQLLGIACLNEILAKHGVQKEIRRKICVEHAYQSSNFLDAGWLKVSGRQVWPTLCFAEKRVDPEEGLGDPTKLYAPGGFQLHEYANSGVVEYFDEFGESVENLDFGAI